MFWLAHLAVGLIIGELTGHHLVAVAVSLLVDLDHAYSYMRNGILSSPRTFWEYVTNKDKGTKELKEKDFPLHSLFVAVPLCALVLLAGVPWGIAFALAYACHLACDAVSTSYKYFLWPLKHKIRGFIEYCSRTEHAITALLFLAFLALRLDLI